MYDAVFIPTPKYIPDRWVTEDLGEFVQYDPKFFKVVQIPEKQRMGLKCIRPKGEIPQPVGLTDYGYMFSGSRIGSVDMFGWDFSEVRSIACFFIDCFKISKIKCDGLDFRKCVDFHKMCYNCDSLKSIDANTWLLDEISTAAEMFAECDDLVECLISNWVTTKLDTTMGMFENCRSLKRMDIGRWNTPDLNVANRMFKGCTKLEHVNIGFSNVRGLIDIDRIFMDCRSLKTVIMPDLSDSPNCTLYLSFDGTPNSVRPKIYLDYMSRYAQEDSKESGDWY